MRRGLFRGDASAMSTPKSENVVKRFCCNTLAIAANVRFSCRATKRLPGASTSTPANASRMRNTLWHQPATNPQCREEFLKIARTYGIAVGAEVCELALRLAFRPGTIRLGDPDKVARAFEELAGNPVVARGAYLVKLATDMTARGRAASTGGEAG
jgi:hypothetical protein